MELGWSFYICVILFSLLIGTLGLMLTCLGGMMDLAMGMAYNLPYFSVIYHKVPEKD